MNKERITVSKKKDIADFTRKKRRYWHIADFERSTADGRPGREIGLISK
jgi:hypothetical protein